MGRKLLFVFIVLISLFVFTPNSLKGVEAAPTRCKALRPSTPPILTSAVPVDKKVTLTWIETPDPVTNYVLIYSTTPTGMEYGSPDIGGKGTTSYTVSELQNGVKYYFRVRGVSYCQPGKLSNKLSAIPGTGSGSTGGKTSTSTGGPNLTLYKRVLSATTSADVEKKETPVVVLPIKPTCEACKAWPLLAGEAVILLAYFYFANKLPVLKKTGSILIPIGAYITFLMINRGCTNNSFWCKYFLEMDIIIYIFSVIAYKHPYIQRKFNTNPRKKKAK